MSARGPKRRRPGRLRRWVLRPAAWSLALVVVLFAAVVLYLESAAFADLARRVAERRLTEALGREVTIGAVALDLVPFSVTVENVSIAGPAPGAAPLFSLARGLVEAEPAGLFGRGLALDHVYLVEPRLEIVLVKADLQTRPSSSKPISWSSRVWRSALTRTAARICRVPVAARSAGRWSCGLAPSRSKGAS